MKVLRNTYMPKGHCLLLSAKHITTEEAKRIGEALIVDWSKFDVEQFRMGLDVELEHGISDLQTNVTHPDEIAKLIIDAVKGSTK